MDVMFLVIALVAFFGMVAAWMTLPASRAVAEPSRVSIPRAAIAEASRA